MTEHVRLIKGNNTQCALVWGSPTWTAPFLRSPLGCAKGEGRLFLPFSPTGGSRGLVRGQLWRRDGVLAVSCAQEGVIRVTPPVTESRL